MASLVDRITDAQRHRGPDGGGRWESEGQEVVFGHRRLAILDLSPAGAQPMVEDGSGWAVTFNGEPLLDRPKSGFVLPIDAWSRRRLRPAMDARFADAALARRVGLRAEAVRTLWRSFEAGRRGLYWSRVWALYVLLSWCEAHDLALAA